MLGHEIELRLTTADLDVEGNIKAATLLHYFQEVAILDAETSGYGFDILMKNDQIWVMTKLKYKIYEKLETDTGYTLATYPRPKRTVTFSRDYYIFDKDGNVLVAATSLWCVLNFKTRKIERAKFDFEGEYYPKNAFEGSIEKIHSLDSVLAGKHVVSREDLDQNEHTNNCRYADMVTEVTGRSDFREMVINFSKETRLGDEILLYCGSSADKSGKVKTGRSEQASVDKNMGGRAECRIVEGKLADGSVIFQAKIQTS